MHATSTVPSTSVLSSLNSALGSLQNAFPSSSSSHLHPFTSNSSDVFNQRDKLTHEIAAVTKSLKSFRQSWTTEKQVVDAGRPAHSSNPLNGSGQDSRELDSELERRKLATIRVMMDWCHNDNTLLTTSSAISRIAPPPRKRLNKNPFVHAQTLVNPTERLQAIASSIPLDVYLNNEDPDLGNATDQPGNVRIDTLSFGGERMAIDMDIRHPKWEANAAGRERYTSQDGWQVVKCEVSYFPLGGEMAEPIVLPWMSEVLTSYLIRYISVVNTSQLELNALEASDGDSVLSIPFADENESLALQAEKIILAFSENVADIATLDERMKKVEFEPISSEPVTPRPMSLEEARAERNWFLEAETLGLSMQSIRSPSISASEHASIFPTFTVPAAAIPGRGPKCSVKPLPKSHGPVVLLSTSPQMRSQSMEVEQPENQALLASSGWMLDFEEDVLIGQAALRSGHSDVPAAQPTSKKLALTVEGSIDESLLTGLLRSSTFCHRPGHPEAPTIHFNPGYTDVQGIHLSRIALQNFDIVPVVEQVKSIAEKLQLDLLLTQMQSSCYQEAMREKSLAPRGQEEIDGELNALMSGGKLPDSSLSLTVTRCSSWLEISLPLPAVKAAGLRLMVISLAPRFDSGGKIEMSIGQQARPEGTSLDSAMLFDTAEAGQRLTHARYNLPVWLEWVTKYIQY